jgi:hypothetical protein
MNSTKALGRKGNNEIRLGEDPQIPHIKRV